MDVDGCTDDQRAQIAAMSRRTHALATLAARLPQGDGASDAPAPASSDATRFDAALQDFETRRQRMQRDLDQMRAVRLR
jgi:hypothetical protein